MNALDQILDAIEDELPSRSLTVSDLEALDYKIKYAQLCFLREIAAELRDMNKR